MLLSPLTIQAAALCVLALGAAICAVAFWLDAEKVGKAYRLVALTRGTYELLYAPLATPVAGLTAGSPYVVRFKYSSLYQLQARNPLLVSVRIGPSVKTLDRNAENAVARLP